MPGSVVELVKSGRIELGPVFNCPKYDGVTPPKDLKKLVAIEHFSYVFFGSAVPLKTKGGKYVLPDDADKIVLAWDIKPNHGNKRYVLFFDGHIEAGSRGRSWLL